MELCSRTLHLSRDCAVNTSDGVATGGQAVLVVTHSVELIRWVFCAHGEDEAEAIVSFGSLLNRDPSLEEIVDLPPGWVARREARGQPWVREPAHPGLCQPLRQCA